MRRLYFISSLFFTPVICQANTYFGDVHVSHVTPSADQAIWQANNQPTPKYPVALAKQLTMGCGIFNVEISAEGKTNNVSLISEVTNKKSLAKETIKTLKRFKWQLQAGQPPDQADRNAERAGQNSACRASSPIIEAPDLSSRSSRSDRCPPIVSARPPPVRNGPPPRRPRRTGQSPNTARRPVR